MKALAALKANVSIFEEATLMFDEIYLQQCDQYSGGKVEVSDVDGHDGNLYKLYLLSSYSSNLYIKRITRSCSKNLLLFFINI